MYFPECVQLENHGFGIVTVDDIGNVAIQHNCIPLAQYIPHDEFDRDLRELPLRMKVAFKTAYEVYLTNEGQGLQDSGQIVEAIITSICEHAVNRGVVTNATLGKPLAFRIDDLYASNAFQNHRAALGGARSFIQEFRNVASHPPRNGKEAAQKIRKCKAGFLDSISIASKLCRVAKTLNYPIRIHLP